MSSDVKLGMGVVIKVEKDWRGVGRPQVAMHSHLPSTITNATSLNQFTNTLARADLTSYLQYRF